jgi:hypothetical protein
VILGDGGGLVAMTKRTELARQWSPPEQPMAWIPLGLMTIFTFGALCFGIAFLASLGQHNVYDGDNGAGSYFFGMCFCAVGAILFFGFWRGGMRREQEASEEMKTWLKTWVCLRCGQGHTR